MTVNSNLIKDSKHFCILPWVHMHVLPTGRVLPCCVADWDQPLGNVRENTLREIWNQESMRQLRRRMLDDKPSSNCTNCIDSERLRTDSGSPRTEFNALYSHHFPEVEKTHADGSLPEFKMRYIDVRFSNICNFRCRTCCPVSSSAWKAEALAVYSESSAESSDGVTEPLPEGGILEQIEPHLDTVEEIYFAGGEPMFMPEHYQILKTMVARGRTDVRLNYNTNLSRLAQGGVSVLEEWRHFPDIRLAISLDGTGKKGEYIRKGLSWKTLLANRKRIAEHCPHARIQVHCTLNVLNAFHLPEMHRELVEMQFVTPTNLWVNYLRKREYLCVQVLPPAHKRRLREVYEAYGDYLVSTGMPDAQEVRECFLNILAFAELQDQSSRLSELKSYTRKLDSLRGERVEEVFPELAEIFR